MRKLMRNIARAHVAKEGIQYPNKRKASKCSVFAENWREYAKERINALALQEAAKKAVNPNSEHTADYEHRVSA